MAMFSYRQRQCQRRLLLVAVLWWSLALSLASLAAAEVSLASHSPPPPLWSLGQQLRLHMARMKSSSSSEQLLLERYPAAPLWPPSSPSSSSATTTTTTTTTSTRLRKRSTTATPTTVGDSNDTPNDVGEDFQPTVQTADGLLQFEIRCQPPARLLSPGEPGSSASPSHSSSSTSTASPSTTTTPTTSRYCAQAGRAFLESGEHFTRVLALRRAVRVRVALYEFCDPATGQANDEPTLGGVGGGGDSSTSSTSSPSPSPSPSPPPPSCSVLGFTSPAGYYRLPAGRDLELARYVVFPQAVVRQALSSSGGGGGSTSTNTNTNSADDQLRRGPDCFMSLNARFNYTFDGHGGSGGGGAMDDSSSSPPSPSTSSSSSSDKSRVDARLVILHEMLHCLGLVSNVRPLADYLVGKGKGATTATTTNTSSSSASSAAASLADSDSDDYRTILCPSGGSGAAVGDVGNGDGSAEDGSLRFGPMTVYDYYLADARTGRRWSESFADWRRLVVASGDDADHQRLQQQRAARQLGREFHRQSTTARAVQFMYPRYVTHPWELAWSGSGSPSSSNSSSSLSSFSPSLGLSGRALETGQLGVYLYTRPPYMPGSTLSHFDFGHGHGDGGDGDHGYDHGNDHYDVTQERLFDAAIPASVTMESYLQAPGAESSASTSTASATPHNNPHSYYPFGSNALAALATIGYDLRPSVARQVARDLPRTASSSTSPTSSTSPSACPRCLTTTTLLVPRLLLFCIALVLL